jgi:hypothetical protein
MCVGYAQDEEERKGEGSVGHGDKPPLAITSMVAQRGTIRRFQKTRKRALTFARPSGT